MSQHGREVAMSQHSRKVERELVNIQKGSHGETGRKRTRREQAYCFYNNPDLWELIHSYGSIQSMEAAFIHSFKWVEFSRPNFLPLDSTS